MVSNPLQTLENYKASWKKGILVSGGWHPGNSTDYVAAFLAVRHKASKVIIATNMDYIYNKDFRKYANAKKIKDLTWREYEKICGGKWKAGMSIPLDPAAAKLSRQKKLLTYLLRGTNFTNFRKALHDKPFKGSIIHS